MEETKGITSVQEYLDEVFKYTAGFNDNDDVTLFYRGHYDVDWKLQASIFRYNRLQKERDIFYKVSGLYSDVFTTDMTAFDKLVLMQHYEMPTRLLDLSLNPLVALFFACYDMASDAKKVADKDSAVLCFAEKSSKIKQYDSDCVAMISNLAKCKESVLLDELVHQIKQEKSFNETLIKTEDLDKFFFVLPKYNNERIKVQKGAFIIVGGASVSSRNLITKESKGDIKLCNVDVKKIIIKAGSQETILKQLTHLGITKSSLYCDFSYQAKSVVQSVLPENGNK